jgi:hypothetical protein
MCQRSHSGNFAANSGGVVSDRSAADSAICAMSTLGGLPDATLPVDREQVPGQLKTRTYLLAKVVRIRNTFRFQRVVLRAIMVNNNRRGRSFPPSAPFTRQVLPGMHFVPLYLQEWQGTAG